MEDSVPLHENALAGSLTLWITLALIVFWGVGLYNRLMRMRSRGLGALGSVEKHMRHYCELVQKQGLVIDAAFELRSGVAERSLPIGWSRLLVDLQSLERSLKEAVATPLAVDAMASLGESYATLQASWRDLNETPADLAGSVIPAGMQAHWDVITQRVDSARGGFNQILAQYNEALDQIPARWVVGVMGFKPGGLL